MSFSILIVDDELDIQSSLSFALKDEGYEVLTATLPAEAEEILKTHTIDMALFDVWFPQGDGIDLLKHTREKYPHISVVMMSGHGNIELALKAIRMGAYDFLEKPLELEKLLVVLRNATESLRLRDENKRLLSQIIGDAHFDFQSNSMKSLEETIKRAAESSSHVLIHGHSGSGKELVARRLHSLSNRKDHAFVPVNCAAIPEGLLESELFGYEKGAVPGAVTRGIGRFEQAEGGTLFLDEIGELSLAAQGKLLRVLEQRTYERVGGRTLLKTSARILAATNRDLNEEIKAGRFREDLYFRLKVLSINVPSLKERIDDMPLLVQQLSVKIATDLARPLPTFSTELVSWMQHYDWPGNVRELRNLIERMIIMSPDRTTLGLADLPEELQALSIDYSPKNDFQVKDTNEPLRELRARFEMSIISQRMEKMLGNVKKTAESLGIERTHLHRKLKQYGIKFGGDA